MEKLTYKKSGVNIDEADRLISYIKKAVKSTYSPQVLTGIGGFSAAFSVPGGYRDPVLVSCTDGVGTKLKIAFGTGRHNTIGIDLVAMSVNDLIACGAKPLFFLDYFATGKLVKDQAKEVISGIVEGCKISGCALIGGETAEMPGFYSKGEYDLSGFAVGIAEKSKIITGSKIKEGDVVIGLASSGLHSNGFSLVRKLIKGRQMYKLADTLLAPTRIYSNVILKLIKKFRINGIAHITGGGLLDNVPRILPEGIGVVLEKDKWPVPIIFDILKKRGNICDKEMHRTFNMGIGMVIVAPASQASQIVKFANRYEKAYIIGKAEKGKRAVKIV